MDPAAFELRLLTRLGFNVMSPVDSVIKITDHFSVERNTTPSR